LEFEVSFEVGHLGVCLGRINSWPTFKYRKDCPEFSDRWQSVRKAPKALRELVEVLCGPNSLTPGEREIIATYVSSQNDCCFCQFSHGAAAAEHLGGNYDLIARVKRNYANAEISDKLKLLLAIAGKVQKGGKHVRSEDVAGARQEGATDKEIHDTVLIAAAFCMFNRYVDGLDTWQPTDPNDYSEMGQIMAHVGYVRPNWGETGEAA
jgi:uncharacterized peroxidase-related enzyme